MRTRGRGLALLAGVAFLLQSACFLGRPGIQDNEVHWAALKTWIYPALFALHRPGPVPLRFVTLTAGALAVVFAMRFFRRAAGPLCAVVGGLLLATDPLFLFAARLDSFDLALPILFSTAAYLLFLKFWHDTSRSSLAVACFCVGLAIWNRLDAAWLWLGVSAAALLVFHREIAAVWGSRNLLPAVAGLAAGCAPLLLSRPTMPDPLSAGGLLSSSTFFNTVFRTQPGTWGIGPSGFLERFCYTFSLAFGSPHGDLLPVACLAAFVALLAASPWILRSPDTRALRFALLAPALVLVTFALTGPFTADRALLTIPLPHLLLAASLAYIARRWTAGYALVAAALLTLVFSSLALTATYYSAAIVYGGTLPWTSAIYRLAEDFDLHDAHTVRILSSGIERPLQFLRRGKVPVVQTDGGEDTLFVANTESASQDTIATLTASTHRHLHLVRYIQDAQGRAVFVLFRLE